MFKMRVIQLCTFMIIHMYSASMVYASPLVLTMMGKGIEYYQDKKLDDKLSEIQQDIIDIKKKLDLLINANLNAAISALEDTKELKSESEKLDNIRSAKQFLLQAINTETEINRKAFAQYLLGHAYLILGEDKVAKKHFEAVIAQSYPIKKGYISDKVEYNISLKKLKLQAAEMLCYYKGKVTSIKDDWCAILTNYQLVKQEDIKHLEKCLQTKDDVSCSTVGIHIIQQMIQVQHQNTRRSQVMFKNQFRKNPPSTIQLKQVDKLLPDQCSTLKNGIDINACLNKARLYEALKLPHEALKLYKNLCQVHVEDEELMEKITYTCQHLLYDPFWSLLSSQEKIRYAQSQCITDHIIACEQLIQSISPYDKDLRVTLMYLATQCLYKEQSQKSQPHCELLKKDRKKRSINTHIRIDSIKIKGSNEGSSWDIRGGGPPDIQVSMSYMINNSNHVPLYLSNFNIESSKLNADQDILSYTAIPIYEDSISFPSILRPMLKIEVVDIDTSNNDMIGSINISLDELTKKKSLSFGQVIDLKFSIIQQ